jgi:hypothetical protein
MAPMVAVSPSTTGQHPGGQLAAMTARQAIVAWDKASKGRRKCGARVRRIHRGPVPYIGLKLDKIALLSYKLLI